jgi:hypothetical protein
MASPPKKKPPRAQPKEDPPREPPQAWVDERRRHRHGLSQAGQKRWDKVGDQARLAYLEAVRAALEAEGYTSTAFQWRHKGHAYGLIKDLGDKQIHVRVYQDGVIDAEIEIHKRYLQHLWSPRPSAHDEVQKVFDKHGIDTELVNEQYLPQVGPLREAFPERRTKVTTVAGSAAAVVGGLVVASLARMYVKRR